MNNVTWVKRVWRRDGTENYMPLDVAIANIQKNELRGVDDEDGPPLRQRSKSEIRADLLSGEWLMTPHANFHLHGG